MTCTVPEFASPARSPWQTGDITAIEKVQEKALRKTSALKGDRYEERCGEAGLNTRGKEKNTGQSLRSSKSEKE